MQINCRARYWMLAILVLVGSTGAHAQDTTAPRGLNYSPLNNSANGIIATGFEMHGLTAMAIHLAYEAFKANPDLPPDMKQIHLYNVSVRRERGFYFVRFSPMVPGVSTVAGDRGAAAKTGRQVEFTVSVHEDKVIDKKYGM